PPDQSTDAEPEISEYSSFPDESTVEAEAGGTSPDRAAAPSQSSAPEDNYTEDSYEEDAAPNPPATKAAEPSPRATDSAEVEPAPEPNATAPEVNGIAPEEAAEPNQQLQMEELMGAAGSNDAPSQLLLELEDKEREEEWQRQKEDEAEERIQRSDDRFWGVDKAEQQRQAEERDMERQRQREEAEYVLAVLALLVQEAINQQELELYWLSLANTKQHEEMVQQQEREAEYRKQYMRAFFASATSALVTDYSWPSASLPQDYPSVEYSPTSHIDQAEQFLGVPRELLESGLVQTGPGNKPFVPPTSHPAGRATRSSKPRGYLLGVVYSTVGSINTVHSLGSLKSHGKRRPE
ncbi:unnamed protein product, partial [Symbiodinium sp. KB8]